MASPMLAVTVRNKRLRQQLRRHFVIDKTDLIYQNLHYNILNALLRYTGSEA